MHSDSWAGEAFALSVFTKISMVVKAPGDRKKEEMASNNAQAFNPGPVLLRYTH